MEVSVHSCSRRFVRELQLVFPTRDLRGLLAIPVSQRATNDLVEVGPEIAREKDELLERVRFLLTAQGDNRVVSALLTSRTTSPPVPRLGARFCERGGGGWCMDRLH